MASESPQSDFYDSPAFKLFEQDEFFMLHLGSVVAVDVGTDTTVTSEHVFDFVNDWHDYIGDGHVFNCPQSWAQSLVFRLIHQDGRRQR